jgi:hypothetical protein
MLPPRYYSVPHLYTHTDTDTDSQTHIQRTSPLQLLLSLPPYDHCHYVAAWQQVQTAGSERVRLGCRRRTYEPASGPEKWRYK